MIKFIVAILFSAHFSLVFSIFSQLHFMRQLVGGQMRRYLMLSSDVIYVFSHVLLQFSLEEFDYDNPAISSFGLRSKKILQLWLQLDDKKVQCFIIKKEMRRISSNDVSVQYFHQQIQQVGEDLTAENKWHRFLREVFEVVYLPDQSFQTFKERIKEHRNYLQATNFRFCSYARAHHYHFFLQDFPRIPGQPTYALDMNNSLRLTYSQQEKLYKGDRLGNILNRVAFTLPVRQQFLDLFMSRKKGRTHNQAHEQLFSNQDSKWDLDRELYTCKIILKHLQKLTYNYNLWQYALIKKRFQLEFLLDDTFDIEEKKAKLQTYIDSLQQKKKSMSLIWQTNDEMYFHSSLQQKLHDSIQEEYNWQFRQASKRIQYYITRHKNWVEQLSKEESDLQLVLLKIFTYTNSRVAAISEAQVENLKGHILKINNPQKTTLPFLIFNFGRPQLREKVNRMITAFIENNQMDEDQMCKNTLKRLFRGTFQPNQLIHDIGAYESKVMTKNMRDKLKRQMVQKKDRAVQTILLDEYINQSVIDQLTADRKQCLPIFNLSQYKIPICEQQMQMLFYYNNLCKTVSLFEPLIHEDETVMKVLCSPYLDRLLHGIIGQFPIKSIGQLIYNMRDLVEYGMMSNCLKQSAVDSDFQWEFKEDTGVGIVWNEPRKLSQGKNLSHFYSMMMQKMNENQQQNNNEQSDKGKEKQNEEGFDQDEKQQLGNIPVKKVKQNQNQHY